VTSPAALSTRVAVLRRYVMADSTDCRNGSCLIVEVVVMRRGRLPVPRVDRLAFWDGVRAGLPVREAAAVAGAERTAEQWFRAAGGVKGKRAAGAGERPVPVGGRAGGDRGGGGGGGAAAGDRGPAGAGAVDGEPGDPPERDPAGVPGGGRSRRRPSSGRGGRRPRSWPGIPGCAAGFRTGCGNAGRRRRSASCWHGSSRASRRCGCLAQRSLTP
jgi:hypothetical protein